MIVPEGKKNKYIILVEVTGEDILFYDKYPEKSIERSFVNKDMTMLTACTFNIYTKMYADNSVYRVKKGDYIKKDGRRYYLKDFV